MVYTLAEDIIEFIDRYLDIDVWLPGGWSPILFFNDFKEWPPLSEEVLAKSLKEANDSGDTMSYEDFFFKTRGKHRILTPTQNRLLEIFNSNTIGPIMLYFEEVFLTLFNKAQFNSIDETLLSIVKRLSKLPINQWNSALSHYNNIDWKIFSKKPYESIRSTMIKHK